jgi:hypothetical protein
MSLPEALDGPADTCAAHAAEIADRRDGVSVFVIDDRDWPAADG